MMCQSCGENAELRDSDFGMNIGAFIVRFHWVKQGRMCATCIHKTFWAYTLTTLLLGWWGVISFFVTPFILLMNIFTYATVFLMKPYPIDPGPTALCAAVVSKLEPYRGEIFRRLFKGEGMQQVAEEIGARVGVGAQDVKAFYNQAR